MTRISTAASATLLLALGAGCGQSPQASAPDAGVTAITANLAQWKNDFNTKDLDKLLSHYTDDTVVVIPGVPVAKSAEARRAAIKEMIADPAFTLPTLDCQRVEVAKSGDFGFAYCSYTMTMTDPATKKPENDKGSVVEVYKKQTDESWKSVADIAASEMPPAAPPSAKPGK
jgi:uncharacterized protein (TIGR02246 family)